MTKNRSRGPVSVFNLPWNRPSRKRGGDGWESNPPRTPPQRPANGFEDRGRHQPPNIPSVKMLVRQRDADALDAERLRVPGKQADEEAQHPVKLRRPGDRGDQRWLR